MSLLKSLAEANHPYYCSESNYYNDDARMTFQTMSEFLDKFEGADIDLNLCFRWDVKKYEDDDFRDGYYAEVFLMLQRKGKFIPCSIESINESEAERFKKYLIKHLETIKQLWMPLT